MSTSAEPADGTVSRGRGLGLLPRDLALIALFAALIAVLGLMGSVAVFGAAVPITAQTLGVMLAGSVLGAKRGVLAVLAFLVLVSAGLPLLAGGHGGIGVFAGPSAGYLIGWLPGAAVIGWLVTKLTGRAKLPWLIVANVLGGILVIYLFGIPVAAWRAGSGLFATVVSAVGYLPGDVVKVVLSALITQTVHRAYPLPEAGRRRGER
jgi:biotin transport system substrate-specific component